MSKFTLGQRVRVLANPPRQVNTDYIGEEGTITGLLPGDVYNIRWDNADGKTIANFGTWSEDVLIDAERKPFDDLESWERDLLGQPQRPALTLTKDTSRRYAAEADSKVLDEATRKILQAAAAGEAVDAYAFNAALTQAMSSAATRAAHSTGRRMLTSKIRHLSYITQAVIENHADGLPAYETGERSRLVQELRGEISDLKQAASDERRRLCREIDDRAAALIEAAEQVELLNERVTALIVEKTEAEVQVENKQAVLNYALSLLDVTDRARVEGYADRVSEEG